MPVADQPLYALDFSFWKRPYVRLFFHGVEVRFVASVNEAPSGSTLIFWGMRDAGVVLPDGVRVLRIEDGFIRSVGLGADLIRPVSWVIDDLGIYYDATRESRLERILAETAFDDASLQRAATLRERIIAGGLTKYNVGAGGWQRPSNAHRVILVPGQVEPEASIASGAPGGVCAIRCGEGGRPVKAGRAGTARGWRPGRPRGDGAPWPRSRCGRRRRRRAGSPR